MNSLRIAVTLAHALAGWALCAATMGIGMALTSLDTALIIHAIAAPIIFAGVSLAYFRLFHYTAPVPTAGIFIGVVIGMDFFVVAMLINRSLDMFASLLGTWVPFTLIFISTWLTGALVDKSRRLGAAAR